MYILWHIVKSVTPVLLITLILNSSPQNNGQFYAIQALFSCTVKYRYNAIILIFQNFSDSQTIKSLES